MSNPTPETPTPSGADAPEHAAEVDTSVSTSSGGSGTAATRARTRRRAWLIVVAVLVLALIGWVIYDQVRAPGPDVPVPPPASQSAGSTPGGDTNPATSAAARTAVDFTTLSYAGKWTEACQLDADEASCLKIGAQAPAYPLAGPPTVLKEETYPAQGVAGQAYTGVLVSVQRTDVPKPRLVAYLINQDNKVAALEGVSSDEARLTLREILAEHIK